MSSPQNMNTTPPNLMPPDAASSPGHGSPSSALPQSLSPHHSRHASLDPSSAIFSNGQQPTDWTGMLSGAQFQTHRRAPSEHSDVSSSVAPSPYLNQQDSFEAFDPNPSPMLAAQPDQHMYHDALGIEAFSLSDNHQQAHQQQQQQQQQQRHMQQQEGISPRHSPYPSPRMSPSPGFTMPPESQYLLSNDMQNGLNGQSGPEMYNNQPQYGMKNGSIDMGQAAQMAPPEINVELAPPSRDNGFEQPRGENDLDALIPPERGRLHMSSSNVFMLTSSQSSEDVRGPSPILTLRATWLQPPRRPLSPRTTEGISVGGPFHPSTTNSQPTAPPAILRLQPNPVDPPPLRSPTAITSSNSLIQADHPLLVPRSASRNTLQHSNATSAPNVLRVRTTCARISARTPMNVPSCAPSVGRPLLVSTIVNATKACTAARKSSSAGAS